MPSQSIKNYPLTPKPKGPEASKEKEKEVVCLPV